MHLRHDAEGNGRLRAILPLAAAEELEQPLLHGHLVRVPLEPTDPRRKRPRGGTDERGRERRRERRLLEQRPGSVHELDGECRRERSAVHEREPLLEPRLVRLETPRRERVTCEHPLAVLEDEALADQGLEEMRERDHLARGPVRAARHIRLPPVVQQLRKQPTEVAAHARVPAQEPRQPEQHRATDHLVRQGLSHADRAPEQDRALQRRAIGGRDLPLRHVPEACRDAVCRRTGLEGPQHRGPSLVDLPEQRRRELDGLAVADDSPVQAQVERVVRVDPYHR